MRAAVMLTRSFQDLMMEAGYLMRALLNQRREANTVWFNVTEAEHRMLSERGFFKPGERNYLFGMNVQMVRDHK